MGEVSIHENLRRFFTKNTRRSKNLITRSLLRLCDFAFGKFNFLNCKNIYTNLVIKRPAFFYFSKSDIEAINRNVNHYFDIFGSGWILVEYGLISRGFIGRTYVSKSKLGSSVSIMDKSSFNKIRYYISKDYKSIDWHIDFKSGYRWKENEWYRNIRYGHLDSVDIKVPWELSRLQHLPIMAAFYTHCRDIKFATEVIDQILDWISTNPPRYGVNWSCTMDVSIRVINILVSIDLLRVAGYKIDKEIDLIINVSIYSHARHISKNLEWSEFVRGNHYLSNVMGLFVSSIYLQSSTETNSWLIYSAQELIAEADRQFMGDGSHFEESTGYHCLCTEMLTIALIFSMSIPQDRLKNIFNSRALRFKNGAGLKMDTLKILEKNYSECKNILGLGFRDKYLAAIDFIGDIVKPNGEIPLIGDQDSGRIIRLCGDYYFSGSKKISNLKRNFKAQLSWTGFVRPVLQDEYLNKINTLHRDPSYEILGNILLNRDNFLHICGFNIKTLVTKDSFNEASVDKNKTIINVANFIDSSTHENYDVLHFHGRDLLDGLTIHRFSDFGLYIYKSKRLYLSIRCGNSMSDKCGAHAHEDQLSIEMIVDGRDISVDPGTYIYTPSLIHRNLYRSPYVHTSPCTYSFQSENKIADYSPAFGPPKNKKGFLLEITSKRFLGFSTVNGGHVIRIIELYMDRVEIHDHYKLSDSWFPAPQSPFQPAIKIPISAGYGVNE